MQYPAADSASSLRSKLRIGMLILRRVGHADRRPINQPDQSPSQKLARPCDAAIQFLPHATSQFERQRFRQPLSRLAISGRVR